ncbi:MAG: hypothetical protein ACJ763_11275 [Bdellovibrionia bacterium]
MRTRLALLGLGLAVSVVGCASAPTERSHDLNSARPNLPLPPSLDEQQDGSVKPPAVLRSGAETADYSYATGCYHAYERICGKLLTDSQRDVCREDGLDVCEKYAHAFGDWIRSGPGAGTGAPRK